ncbi:MAG: hypothetical protein H0T89_01970 [Deltaproteobacteria bacterium]|nr:hypothetical protein [Deltaproteobacteria bacterium]MDQ3297250.1 hypothetical protein [Myxococcota bacterium]
MTRLLMPLVLFAAVACGGKKSSTTTTTTTGGGSTASTVLVKKIVLSWGITPKGELADIYLATTDETGKQLSHSLGAYKGTCTAFKPAPEMNAITGVSCTTAPGAGTELHAVVQGGEEIIVLQLGLDAGVTPDPMARKEISRIKIPLGIAVEAAP